MQADSDLIVTRQIKPGDSVFYKNKTAAVFIRLNDGTRLNFFMKVIEDYTQTHKSVIGNLHYRQIPATFTGVVVFYTLDRKFINGFRYNNGRKVAALNGTKGGSSNSKLQVNSTGKTVNVAEPEPDPDDCGGETVYWDLDDCTYYPDYGAYDCGDATPVWVVPDDPCDTGGGDPDPGVTGDPTPSSGSSSTTPPPTPAIIDSLTDSCLIKTLNKILLTQNINNTIGNLIDSTFNVSSKVNITYKQDTTLSNTRLANTPAPGSITINNGDTTFNITVSLNEKVLPGASQELTAITMLHEGLHGYFEYYGVAPGDALSQHLLMATKYVNTLRASLKSVFPNLSDADANSLILYEMADIATTSASAFTTLATSYNLTPTTIVNTGNAYLNHTSGTKTSCSTP